MNKDKDYEQLSRKHYNQIAQHFDFSLDGLLSYPFKRLINHNLHLQAGDRILDVGCANGRLLALLGRQAKITAVGLDIAEKMVQKARQNYPEYRFITGSAEDLAVCGEKFDYIICSASFHHFPDPVRFLNSAKQHLSSHGRLIIAEINLPFFHDLYNRMLILKSQEGDVKAYTTGELTNLFSENHFKIMHQQIFFQIQYYELSLQTLD
ncbi:class I SAM-dependent methyltransferase [Oenococcus sicerae]|uniref:Class I SAM-dependent methyltransferase n=1 Tax=Oenococcus sicerae TaxID=2203724 RepID=A0AAJ1R8Q0_9LACO|nr:class I SAM-dependent methyltransferase [Oenococcus sicerae]MDN6899806.1 class I SAM-dependent methyltransferase [Oenococcus sicerae]QAS70492.1 class I SAM-dependent methyltransferase [Oenococcus sicerae]VDK13891.1 hypothetical protein OAL24_00690 [Oenococcus sicerae]